MTEPENHTCPLCGRTSIVPYHRDKARGYLNCRSCNLVFVPPAQHLSAADEKACYDLHDNQPGDPGYRRFLDRLFTAEPTPGSELPGSRLWLRTSLGAGANV